MHRFAAALIFVLLVAPVAGAATTGATGPVLLKTKVIIDESVVRLGDIFDGLSEQAEIAVARAPAPGKRVEVGARWLTAVAQAYGLPWRPSSRLDTTVIERASLVIDTRRIEDATLAALAQRGVKGNVTLLLDNPTLRLHLPSDADSTIAITGLSHDPQTGRFKAYVTAPAEGTPIARATVTGRAVAMTEVPVLRRRIEPGEIIRHEDIDWLRVRTDHLARNALVDVESLLGKSPRRPIRAGEPVLSGELRKPIVVPKNSLITIRLETARMALTAQGRSLESGAKGDVIRVINTKSNKVISANVIDSGTVLVRPDTLSWAR